MAYGIWLAGCTPVEPLSYTLRAICYLPYAISYMPNAMTKINDYLWHLPHEPLPDDPPEIARLQEAFSAPLVATVEGALDEMGYRLSSSDILVRLDDRLDNTADTYYARSEE